MRHLCFRYILAVTRNLARGAVRALSRGVVHFYIKKLEINVAGVSLCNIIYLPQKVPSK